MSNCKNTLVIAGAGSGKSLTIIAKIIYLIKECKIKPQDILVISFTNEATNNLKNNLINNYNIKIDIYTFHKLSLKILKDNNYKYNIAVDNLLDIVIDNFFLNYENKYQKSLRIILGKKYNNKELNNLKQLIKTFITLFKSNNYNFSYYLTILKKIKLTLNLKQYLINKNTLLLIINIHLKYIEELNNNNMIDFDDMINKCSEILKEAIIPKWKHIIIDEYQDTSLTKLNLIKKIIEKTNANFLAVGDDFQSIYRFTGCDLNLFLNFNKYFKFSKIFKIINTYRNPQELINIAGSFIMKNPKQQKKKLVSNKNIKNPIIIYETDNYKKTLKYILELLKEKDIMILSRNNNDIKKYIDNEYKQIDKNTYTYKNITFKYLTIHKSKGLETDNVVLINTEDNITSIPTKIKNDKLLNYVNKEKDYYPYEEERRLFYVALTRTKNRVYIITPKINKSIFVKELLKNKNIKKINY